jgi:hypothetical protein
MTGAEKHSIYGPSAAHRWLNCPGSIKAESEMPEPPESEFASEGSAAHHLAEVCLKDNQKTECYKDYVFPEFPDNPVDQEMVAYVHEYVDYVKSLGGHQEYEQVVHYEEWVPGGFGTADAIVTVDDTLHVIDLKYGKGVPVYAEENPQGMLYALGALSERDSFQKFKLVVIHVHQPRLEHVSTWEITPRHVYEWADFAKVCAKLCTSPNAERIPGEYQCQWCNAKARCSALAVRTENALMKEFNELELSTPAPPENLRDVDLRFILNNKPLIINWLNAVEAHVKERVLNGEGFDGFKIVRGRSNRKWSDEKEAEKILKKLLKDKAYSKKLLTAPAAEKVLGKENKGEISHLIVKPEGAPTLVADTDNREAISFVSADDF